MIFFRDIRQHRPYHKWSVTLKNVYLLQLFRRKFVELNFPLERFLQSNFRKLFAILIFLKAMTYLTSVKFMTTPILMISPGSKPRL